MNQHLPTNQENILTLLVSRPGIMRQSLQASLAIHSWLTVAAACGDGLTALSQISRQQPQLLIIDANLLEEEVEALLTTVKARWSTIRCLVLLQSTQREGPTLAAGADAVIQRDRWEQHAPSVLLQLTQNRP